MWSSLRIREAQPAWLDGVIAAITFLVPVAVGVAGGAGAGTMVAASVATMLVCMVPRDTWFLRRTVDLAVSVVGAVVLVAIAALAAPHDVAAIVLITLVAVGSAFVAQMGPGGRTFASLAPPLTITILTVQRYGTGEPEQLVVAAALGGVWAMGLALLTARLRRERPVSRALGGMYRALGELSSGVRAVDDASWERRRETFRAAVAQVRATAEQPLYSGPVTRQALAQADVQIAQAEAIGEQLEQVRLDGTAADVRSAEILPRLRAWSIEMAEHGTDLLHPFTAEWPEPGPESGPDVLVGRRTAADLVARPTATPRKRAFEPAVFLDWLPARPWRESPVVRFAGRYGLAVALTATPAWLLAGEHGWWLVITVVVIMKPDLDDTMAVVWPRIVGTLAGAILGGALLQPLVGRPLGIALAAAVFLVLMVALRPLGYVFWTFGLSGFVLLTIGLGGHGGWWPVLFRVGATLIGAGVAVIATLWLWPDRRLAGPSDA